MTRINKYILAGTLFFGAILVFSAESFTTKVDCNQQICNSRIQDGSTNLSNGIKQNLEVEVLIYDINQEVKSKKFEKQVRENIELSIVNQNRVLLQIPFKNSDSFYEYLTPEKLTIKSIKIKIFASRTIKILINNKIAYTHFYPIAEFKFDPESPVLVSKNIKHKLNVIENSLNKEHLNPATALGISLLILLLSLITQFFLRKTAQGVIYANVNYRFLQICLGTLVSAWVLCFLLWFRSPLDLVGIKNPSPFGPIGPLFSDFFQIWNVSSFWRPYDLMAINYPPVSLAIFSILSNFSSGYVVFFFTTSAVIILKFVIIQNLKLSNNLKLLIFLLILASYPFLLGIIRGNIDISVSMLLILAYQLREKFMLTAGLLFGLAISLKYWPLVFIVFFWKFSSKKIVAMSIATAISLQAMSIYMLGYRNFLDYFNISKIPLQSQNVDISSNTLGYSSSFLVLCFVLYHLYSDSRPWDLTDNKIQMAIDFVQSNYLWFQISLILICVLIFLFEKARSSIWITCCIFVSFIPEVGYVYRLEPILFGLYLMWDELYVKEFEKLTTSRISFMKMCAVLLLLVPWTLFYIPESLLSLESVVIPFLQLLILGLILISLRFPNKLYGLLKKQLHFV
jgi:hypothetical protein